MHKMLRALQRKLGARTSRALQMEQRRFLNIHEYQVGVYLKVSPFNLLGALSH